MDPALCDDMTRICSAYFERVYFHWIQLILLALAVVIVPEEDPDFSLDKLDADTKRLIQGCVNRGSSELGLDKYCGVRSVMTKG